jgi:hypothetical protein
MTFYSLQEIENKYPESEIDSPAKRRNKNRAIKRFNERQQLADAAYAGSSTSHNQTKRKSREVLTEQETNIQQQKRTKTTANSTKRKRKSRDALTDEQRTNILEQNRNIYATQQEQIRNQCLKIACCNIDDFNENIVNGNEIENNRHNLKGMNNICSKCQALKWNKESKGFCCQNGQVVLAPLLPAPPCLFNLLTTNDPISNEPYVNQIRSYNQVLAFTSLGANIDNELANAREGVVLRSG